MDYSRVFIPTTRALVNELVPDVITRIIMEYLAFIETPVVFTHDEDWMDSMIYHIDDYAYYGWIRSKEKVLQAYLYQPEAIVRMRLMRSIYCDFSTATRSDRLMMGRFALITGNKRWIMAMIDDLQQDDDIVRLLPEKYAELVYNKKKVHNCGVHSIEYYCNHYL